VRRVGDYPLWIGTARDARDLRGVLDAGIEAVVDLAMDEPPVSPTRELVYLRFPLVDGEGHPPWLLGLTVSAVEPLIRSGVPTLIACGGGMSRSLAIAASAVWFRESVRTLDEVLVRVRGDGPADVHPALWHDLKQHVFTVSSATFYRPRD
jgi:hypothetical protein